MNILLLGSSGILGSELNKLLKKKNNLTNNGTKYRRKDLRSKKNIQELLLAKEYDLVINSAAITNINFCEKNKKLSEKVNIDIIKNIFFIKKNFNLKFKFIQFSTDQVYNSLAGKFSKENSKAVIFNEYTRQKIKAEKICEKNKAFIFRTNFFAHKKGSLFKWVVDKANGKDQFFLFDDVFFNPLRIKTICKLIDKIIVNKRFCNGGIYNLGSKDALSKSKFGLEIIKKLKIADSRHKIISFKKVLKTKRPSNMSMDVSKFEKKFEINLPKLKNEIIDEINENVKNKN